MVGGESYKQISVQGEGLLNTDRLIICACHSFK